MKDILFTQLSERIENMKLDGMFDAWQLTFILDSAILYSGHGNTNKGERMKKQYIRGYKYWFSPASLYMLSSVVLENKLPYGNGRLEAQIICEQGKFHVYITDGFKAVATMNSLKSLKTAMNLAHGRMVDLSTKK